MKRCRPCCEEIERSRCMKSPIFVGIALVSRFKRWSKYLRVFVDHVE